MDRWLSGLSDLFYAMLRLIAGAAFACHGAQKLFGVLGSHHRVSDPKMMAAGVVEFVGGLLVAVGLFAGFAAFVAAGEMAYAYFTVHAPKNPWPIVNGGELAVLYCFVFLYIASRGSGRISLEGAFGGGRARRR